MKYRFAIQTRHRLPFSRIACKLMVKEQLIIRRYCIYIRIYPCALGDYNRNIYILL